MVSIAKQSETLVRKNLIRKNLPTIIIFLIGLTLGIFLGYITGMISL